MKYIIFFTYIFLFTSTISCYEKHPTNHSSALAIHTQFYIPPDTHSHPLHLSQQSYKQKQYYINDLSPAQKRTVIQNFMNQLGYLQETIPYMLYAPTDNIQQVAPNTLLCELTLPPEPLPQLLYTESYISDLQDQLFIQQQCLEWENHIDILNMRNVALERIKNGTNEISTKYYTLSEKMNRYCDTHDLNGNIVKQCTGSILQQAIHHEFVTITKKSARIWNAHKTHDSFKKTTKIIANFTDAGITHNNNNEIKHAIDLANACWMILDCIQAAAEGLIDGTKHLVNDITHPIRTTQNIIESTITCGYYIGKVVIEIGQVGYLAILSARPECHESGVSKGNSSTILRERLHVWKENFSLICDVIQEKRSSLRNRDIIKETVSLGIQCYATPKILRGLGILFKQAHKQVATFANNIPALKKAPNLITPEGIIVRIAEHTAEYMENEYILKTIGVDNTVVPKKMHLTKNQLGRSYLKIENPILNNIRSGSALKEDTLHAFSDIIDNYATYAKKFKLIGGDGHTYNLYQIEGSLNGKSGIFEWIIDPNPIKGVTHRRFIEGVPITGKPNAIKKRSS